MATSLETGNIENIIDPQRIVETEFLRSWQNFTPLQRARLWPSLKTILENPRLMEQGLLSIAESAAILNISRQRVSKLIHTGQLTPIIDTQGHITIPAHQIHSYKPRQPGRPSSLSSDLINLDI